MLNRLYECTTCAANPFWEKFYKTDTYVQPPGSSEKVYYLDFLRYEVLRKRL